MSGKVVFDVVVLGGGPGGYTAAFRAADLGLSVCLIEKRAHLGGVCLNEGCIPSKTLLHAASVVEEAEEAADFGISFQPPKIEVESLLAKKNSVIAQLTSGLSGLCKARKITLFNGHGVFKDRETIVVTGADGVMDVNFKNVIIATGSQPAMLPGIPVDRRIWDSTAALEIQFVPKRFLIIGGGIIGLEMAQIYSVLGAEITIVEMLDHIIPPADKDLIQPLFLRLKKKYRILTKTKVTNIRPEESGIQVSFEGPKASGSGEYDAVLMAVGRKANTSGMGFEKMGLKINKRGFIEVNRRQETAISHFFAVGDVVGEPMLAHKACHEGKVAAETIAGGNAFSPQTIPAVAYTRPEVAWVGMTEQQARAEKRQYKKGKFPWGASGRALSAGLATGVTKALFDKESGCLIGAGICGANAGELIHEAAIALGMDATCENISKTVHAHPTLAETFAFAAEIVDGSITDMLPPKKR